LTLIVYDIFQPCDSFYMESYYPSVPWSGWPQSAASFLRLCQKSAGFSVGVGMEDMATVAHSATRLQTD